MSDPEKVLELQQTDQYMHMQLLLEKMQISYKAENKNYKSTWNTLYCPGYHSSKGQPKLLKDYNNSYRYNLWYSVA